MADAGKPQEPKADSELFTEFMSPGAQNAVQLYQFFNDLRLGGFTEGQALTFLGSMMASMILGGPPGV